jgi:hypothetical protein
VSLTANFPRYHDGGVVQKAASDALGGNFASLLSKSYATDGGAPEGRCPDCPHLPAAASSLYEDRRPGSRDRKRTRCCLVRGTEGLERRVVGNESRHESSKAYLKWNDLFDQNVWQIVVQLNVGTLNA